MRQGLQSVKLEVAFSADSAPGKSGGSDLNNRGNHDAVSNGEATMQILVLLRRLAAAGLALCIMETHASSVAALEEPASNLDSAAISYSLLPSSAPSVPGASASDRAIAMTVTTRVPSASEPVSSAVTSTDMDAAAVAAIFRRLDPVREAPKRAFNFPGESSPPPKAGKILKEPFPPTASVGPAPRLVATRPAPLAVSRYSPEGDVSFASTRLAVQFSQPMVPLTSLADANNQQAAKLSPAVAGHWRWLDTRTYVFEPSGNVFPCATKFTAAVPTGLKSTGGNALAKGKSWSFQTPAVKVTSFFPHSDTDTLKPLLFMGFNQKIDPLAILQKLRVQINTYTQSGATTRSTSELSIANESELEPNNPLSRVVGGYKREQRLLFRVNQNLPKNSTVTVVLPAGSPSAEGPLLTTSDQEFSFRTYGPLSVHLPRVLPQAVPKDDIRISCSNSLNAQTFRPAMVKIVPEIPGVRITTSYNEISIVGTKKSGIKYAATVSADLTDVYGQRLGKPATLKFLVRDYAPDAFVPGINSLTTITPDMPQEFRFYTVNQKQCRVRAWTANPEQWEAYVRDPRGLAQMLKKRTPIIDRKYSFKVDNAVSETVLDLKSTFAKGSTQLLVLVDAGRRSVRPVPLSWIQFTDIGLSAIYDKRKFSVSARSLVDGKPIAKVRVAFFPATGPSAFTSTAGIATIDLPATKTPKLLVANSATNSCILPQRGQQWKRREQSDQFVWYTFTDRGVYRPGEEVHFKGFVRKATAGPKGDVTSAGLTAPLRFTVRDPQGAEVSRGSCAIDSFGAFHGSFKIGRTPTLGQTSIDFVLPLMAGKQGASVSQGFLVQEFRRPEFQVAVASEGNPPAVFGTPLLFSTEAHYLSGGQLTNSGVEWNVTASRGTFNPAGWSDYSFGRWRGWSSNEERIQCDEPVSTTVNSTTDSSGRGGISVDITDAGQATPLVISAQATVSDVTRQTFSKSAAVLLHPSTRYVGLKPERVYFSSLKPVRFSTVVTGIDGKVSAGTRATFKLYRLVDRKPRELVEEAEQVSGPEPALVTFKTSVGGSYALVAECVDSEQRWNMTETRFAIYEGDWGSSKTKKSLRLIPDKVRYRSGEAAEIIVVSPFPTADGVVTVSRSGIISRSHFSVKDGTATLRIPIEEGYVPNVNVNVDLAGRIGAPEDGFGNNTARDSGSIDLSVSTDKRALQVEVKPRESLLMPGQTTSASVVVKDADGKPAAGQQVSLVVVDEAVLALTNYKLGEPLTSIYQWRSSDLAESNSYDQIQTINPKQEMRTAGSLLVYERANNISFAGWSQVCRGGGGCGSGSAGDPESVLNDLYISTADTTASDNAGQSAVPANKIRIRTNFNALATFKTDLITDATGTASVSYILPDNLTSYRLMAVAADAKNRFGIGESAITVRLPVMARPSAPRFLNFGDECLIPIMVQNQSLEPQIVQLVLRGTVKGLESGLGKVATLAPGDRHEFLFPAKADSVGTASFQTAVATAGHADALEFSLPVYTPATNEQVATYGTMDGDGVVAQSVAVPANIIPQFGELKVSTSSTLLNELSDAVSYISDYPYDCSEQLSSKILVFASLKDAAGAFGLTKLQIAKSIRLVDSSIAKVSDRQHSDGSFGLWSVEDHDRWPYLSVYVTHAFVIAKQKGFKVSEAVLSRAHTYLQGIENDSEVLKYPPTARHAVLAYALYVRALLGDSHPEKALKLFGEAAVNKHSLETLAYLAMVLQRDKKFGPQIDSIRTYLGGRITETASKARIKSDSSYEEWRYRLFYSEVRDDALQLLAAIQYSPNSDLVQKLLRGLLSSRRNGAWSNTQENAFAALAIDSYFNTYEKETPNFTASAWLGARALLQQQFAGRSTDTRIVEVPMPYLAEKAAREKITLAKKGPGRLYYRFGMNYAPSSLKLAALDNGFAVERTYEAVDEADHVRKDENGRWHIKAGALVRVKLKVKIGGPRYHVALVDQLPGGFEILNCALAGTKVVESVPTNHSGREESQWWNWAASSVWWDHQNLRDNRAEAFGSCLWDGSYDYTYIARATTPGTFIAPPAKAEEMYEPETFGRTASETVLVEK